MEIFDIMITQFTLNLSHIFSVKQIINTGLYVCCSIETDRESNRRNVECAISYYLEVIQFASFVGGRSGTSLSGFRLLSQWLTVRGSCSRRLKQNILQLKRFLLCVLTTSRSTKLIASLLNSLFVSLTINETIPKHPNSVFVLVLFYIEHKQTNTVKLDTCHHDSIECF